MQYKIFYSWQMENKKKFKKNKKVILDVINELKKKYVINFIMMPCSNKSGSPNILSEVKQHIKSCDIFIADLSNINTINDRVQQNCNVCFELGIAKSLLNDENIIILSDVEIKLFFDINHDRIYKWTDENIIKYIESAILYSSNNKIQQYHENKCFFCYMQTESKNLKVFRKNNSYILICDVCNRHICGNINKMHEYSNERIDDGTRCVQKKLIDKLVENHVYSSSTEWIKIFNAYIDGNIKIKYPKYKNKFINDFLKNSRECVDNIKQINMDDFYLCDTNKVLDKILKYFNNNRINKLIKYRHDITLIYFHKKELYYFILLKLYESVYKYRFSLNFHYDVIANGIRMNFIKKHWMKKIICDVIEICMYKSNNLKLSNVSILFQILILSYLYFGNDKNYYFNSVFHMLYENKYILTNMNSKYDAIIIIEDIINLAEKIKYNVYENIDAFNKKHNVNVHFDYDLICIFNDL